MVEFFLSLRVASYCHLVLDLLANAFALIADKDVPEKSLRVKNRQRSIGISFASFQSGVLGLNGIEKGYSTRTQISESLLESVSNTIGIVKDVDAMLAHIVLPTEFLYHMFLQDDIHSFDSNMPCSKNGLFL